MDPLSEVFALLDVRMADFARFDAGSPWAIDFTGYRSVKVGAVLHGSCWIWAEGVAEPVHLSEGDCYLLGNGRAYWMASGPDVPKVPSAEVFADFDGVALRVGSGADVTIVSCRFTFDAANAAVLLDVLPPLIHVPADSESADAVRAAMRLLRFEAESPTFGSDLVNERVAHIVFVQALRAHVAAQRAQGGAWLTALADRRIGAALTLMHQRPAHRWTVGELATEIGMSRSSFAARFTELVGTPPLDYLLGWRMRTAGRELRFTDRTVAAVASEWGYDSESAFSNAFKRVMGSSPGRYRKESVAVG
jgi:AraC-like DNA-binding protein